MSLLKPTCCTLLATALITACGNSSNSATPQTGALVDAAVSGISYTTSSGLTGLTNEKGEFQFRPGDTVSFSLGSLPLGTAVANTQVAPSDIAAQATGNGANSAGVANNIARFLQTFDSDGNPDNGITIPASTASAASSIGKIDLTGTALDTDSNFQKLADAAKVAIVTAEQAGEHSRRSLLGQMAGTWLLKDDATGALRAFTYFADGNYISGGDDKDPNCTTGVEWGRLQLDADSRSFTVDNALNVIDTDGTCGLNDPTKNTPQKFTNLVVTATTLSATNPDGSRVTLTKAADSSVAGAWLLDQPRDSGTSTNGGKSITPPAVVVFLGNGKYVLNDTADVAINASTSKPDPAYDGSEIGTWTADSNGKITAVPTLAYTGSNAAGHSLSGATLTVSNNKLSKGSLTYSRVSRDPVVTPADLIGSWYAASDGTTTVTANVSPLYLNFFVDGTVLSGEIGTDPNCYTDYDNNGNQASYSYSDTYPTGNFRGPNSDIAILGAEHVHWRLDGLAGFLSTGIKPGSNDFETGGSCGIYNVLAKALEGRLLLKKIDDNTIQTTNLEFQDGGTGETNNHDYVPHTLIIKRIPKTANSLVGAWVSDGSNETLSFFADNSFVNIKAAMTKDSNNNITAQDGGLNRGTYALDTAGAILTMTVNSDAANCLSSIGNTNADSDPCKASGGSKPAALAQKINLDLVNNLLIFVDAGGNTLKIYRKRG